MAQVIDRIGYRLGVGAQIFRQRHLFASQAQAIDQQITRDVEQPGTRVFKLAKILPLKYGLEENVLQQIVGLRSASSAMRQKSTEFSLVCPPRTIDAAV